MQHMPFIKGFNILSGNDVDFVVPFLVKFLQLPELPNLKGAKVGKVFYYRIQLLNKIFAVFYKVIQQLAGAVQLGFYGSQRCIYLLSNLLVRKLIKVAQLY